jgi:hypothetical protein
VTSSGDNVRRHILAWPLVLMMAIANGTLRDLGYGRLLSRTVAHSLSVLPLVAGIVALSLWLARRWPLPDTRAATRVGLVWLFATLTFEFGLGAATGHPLHELVAQYDVLRGNLWPLVPLTMAVAPALVRHHRRGSAAISRGSAR